MTGSHASLGLIFSVGALVQWSLAPFFFAITGRRIGPFATNLMRLVLATFFLAAACSVEHFWLAPGASLPGFSAWIFFALSGVVGLAIGDHFFYTSLYEIGPERTSLLMTLAPAATVVIAWYFLKEVLSPLQLTGMTLVLGGITAATWPEKSPISETGSEKRPAWKDAWNGVAAAVCQGGGTVLGREAFLAEPQLSPIFATTIRVGAGALAMTLVAILIRKLGSSARGARKPDTAKWLLAGTLVGPVGGMLCYVAALKHLSAGIVTTITFMTPLLIIPLGALWYKTRLNRRTLLGGLSALLGVLLLGW